MYVVHILLATFLIYLVMVHHLLVIFLIFWQRSIHILLTIFLIFLSVWLQIPRDLFTVPVKQMYIFQNYKSCRKYVQALKRKLRVFVRFLSFLTITLFLSNLRVIKTAFTCFPKYKKLVLGQPAWFSVLSDYLLCK